MKGNPTGQPPDRRPAALLALGFTISAISAYASLWLLGAHLLGRLHTSGDAWLAAAALLTLLVLIDSGVVGIRTPSWRRQTPKQLEDRLGPARAAFVWGLDTGLVVTTFRVTSLSWAALALTLLGLVPWWAGSIYALGFTVPVAAFILVVPRHLDPSGRTDPEPVWVFERIMHARAALKRSALVALGTAAAGCLAVAIHALGG